jgi:hypothetical protein
MPAAARGTRPAGTGGPSSRRVARHCSCAACVLGMVNRTGGNRSYRSGPVPAGSQPVQIQNLNLSSKMKKSHKILKNTSRCVQFNGVKNFQIFVHLVYFADIRSSTKKEKREKIGWLNFSCPQKILNGLIFEIFSFDTIRLYASCNIFRKFSYIFSIFISNLKTRQILH